MLLDAAQCHLRPPTIYPKHYCQLKTYFYLCKVFSFFIFMRNLIQFFIRYLVLFLFLILETVAIICIVNHNLYQGSILFSSANKITANILSISNNITDFFQLRTTNQLLSQENTDLLNQISELKHQLENYQTTVADSATLPANVPPTVRFIPAKVVNITTHKIRNYITLNKGEQDGVRPDMGVISNGCVVGIVKNVSKNFCVVIPIINSELGINSKIKRNNYAGILKWPGTNYRIAKLHDIARHVDVQLNDTIITSGFTSNFPEGILVGTIRYANLEESDSYYDIDVELGIDYKKLTYVAIIDNRLYDEQKALEEKAAE